MLNVLESTSLLQLRKHVDLYEKTESTVSTNFVDTW